MSIRNLDKAFRPASVALVAASVREGSLGAAALRNLAGFPGPLSLVAPAGAAPAPMPSFPDIARLPQAPDLAVIAAPPEQIPALVRDLGARGTRAALILGTAYTATSAEGKAALREILAAARPNLVRVIGPASLGIIVPGPGGKPGLNASFAHLAPPPGAIALVSRSNALAAAALDWAQPRRIGFSHVVALGDVSDVDFGDMLDYLATSPEARAILLYTEEVTEARKFMSAARAAARSKPVVVVKASRFAAHCFAEGARTAPDEVYDAAFRRAGALRVRSMPELFAAAETLALTRERRGDRLAILTNGTGPGVLARDALAAEGGRLAAFSPETIARLASLTSPNPEEGPNPIDIPADAPPSHRAAALAAVLEDPGVDAALVLHSPSALEAPDAAAEALIAALAAIPSFAAPSLAMSGRNVFTAWLGEETAAIGRARFVAARIPTYASLDEAVTGFMHRVRYRGNQDLLMEVPPARRDDAPPDQETAAATIAAALAAGRRFLDPDEVFRLLAAYGIPLVPSRAVADGEAAAMLARIRRARPGAKLEGFLVQEMIARPGALELAAGLIDGGVFGPVVTFGPGGSAASGSAAGAPRDASLELPPLNMALARWQVARAGIDLPPAEQDEVAQLLIRIAEIACAHAEIESLCIDPLLADADGVIALDARIAVAPSPRRAAQRLAILPYPAELETTLSLDDGTSIRVRPIRPEDEPLLQEMFRHMSAEDVRLRFLTAMRRMPPALAARLTQIDYDREMALIALDADGSMQGVARFSADPDNARAEFAVAVRSDRKRHSLGRALMTYLLEIAHRRGIGEIYGDVAADNAQMLAFCRALGFTVGPHPDDPQLLLVTRPG